MEYSGREWKEIPGFGGYFVSNDGDVLSLNKGKPRILKKQTDACGYRYVFLYCNRKMTKMRIHRAMLMAWVRLPIEGEEARHLNDKPGENYLENLTWGSRLDNVNDKRRNGGIPCGEKVGSHKLTFSPS